MFTQNDSEKKLDWMYKGANSLVDREDYLLGRSVDKSLEQLNAEERQKQLGTAAPPKNHVEHECIPPSIRDYKLQQQLAEQVDLQAKLQEDPLLTIKKREEETRRQFLQNPVQLKKLQKALSKQESKSKRKKNLDEILLQKLKLLQKGGDDFEDIHDKKGANDNDLDIILMHKFNALKSKLTEEDLKAIMAGKCTGSSADSDDEASQRQKVVKKGKKKKKQGRSKGSLLSSEESNSSVEERPKRKKKKKKEVSSSESESEAEAERQRRKRKSKQKLVQKVKSRKEVDSESTSSGSEESQVYKRKKKKQKRTLKRKPEIKGDSSDCEKSSSDDDKKARKHKARKSMAPKTYKQSKSRKSSDFSREESRKVPSSSHRSRLPIPSKNFSNPERNMQEKSKNSTRSRSRSREKSRKMGPERPPQEYTRRQVSSGDSDENRDRPKIQNWGLVKSDGTQIELTRRSRSRSRDRARRRKDKTLQARQDEPKTAQRNQHRARSRTSAEKEEMLREMRRNADEQDAQRAKNIKRYRDEDEREAKQRKFDADFARKEYMKSTNASTVESRIKANLNNIQRSKNDMNSHFSWRH